MPLPYFSSFPPALLFFILSSFPIHLAILSSIVYFLPSLSVFFPFHFLFSFYLPSFPPILMLHDPVFLLLTFPSFHLPFILSRSSLSLHFSLSLPCLFYLFHLSFPPFFQLSHVSHPFYANLPSLLFLFLFHPVFSFPYFSLFHAHPRAFLLFSFQLFCFASFSCISSFLICHISSHLFSPSSHPFVSYFSLYLCLFRVHFISRLLTSIPVCFVYLFFSCYFLSP